MNGEFIWTTIVIVRLLSFFVISLNSSKLSQFISLVQRIRSEIKVSFWYLFLFLSTKSAW